MSELKTPFFEAAFDLISNEVSIITKDRTILKANTEICERVKKPEGFFRGKKCYEEFESRTEPCVHCPLEAVIQTKICQEVETSDDYSVTASPILDCTGAAIGIVHEKKNISHRKERERALQESQELYYDLFNSTIAGILLNFDASIILANRQAYELYGYDFLLQDLNGQTPLDVIHPDDAARSIDNIRKNHQGSNIYKSIKKDGTIFYGAYRGSFTKYKGKKCRITTFIDVTGQHLAELALKEAKEQQDLLLQATSEGLVIHKDGKLIYCNQQQITLHGYDSLEEILGKDTTEFTAPEYHSLVKKNSTEGFTDPYEVLAQRKDGKTFPAILQGRPFPYGGEIVRIASIRDITKEKASEQILQQSEERYRNAMIASSAAIWDKPVNGEEWWSPELYDILGFTPEELPADLNSFKKLIHPDDSPRITAAIQQQMSGKSTFNEEYRILTKEQGYRWVHARGNIIRGEDGTPQRMTGSLYDITESKVQNSRIRIGELLIDEGYVSLKHISECLKIKNRKLGEILIEKGYIIPELLEKALEKQSLITG